MDNYQQQWNQRSTPVQNWNMEYTADGKQLSAEASKAFIRQVFAWMFGALLLTAVIAWSFAHIPNLLSSVIDTTTGKPTPLFWISAFSPIAIVLIMGFGIEKLSTFAMGGLFILYSALMGISLCTIFLMYEPMLIVKAFGITSVSFGVMAVMGYITKADLSRFGMILMFALFGVIISMFLNMFMHSDQFGYIIDIVCVLVFTGLVAWKMQIIKNVGAQYGSTQPKLAIFWALSLYITFINLLLTILRLLGRRR